MNQPSAPPMSAYAPYEPYAPAKQQQQNFGAMELGQANTMHNRRSGCNCSRRTVIIVSISVIALVALVLGLGLGLGLKNSSSGSIGSASSDYSSSSTPSSPSGNCCTVKCGTIGFSSSGQQCCGNSISSATGEHSYCQPALALAGCDTGC